MSLFYDHAPETPVTGIPSKLTKDYEVMLGRLRQHPGMEEAAREHIHELIERTVNSKNASAIHTAGWMPGRHWEGTPLQPLYEIACRKNFELSGKLFGLMVFEEHIRDSRE